MSYDDLTMPLEKVVSDEIKRDTPEARLKHFVEWANANPDAIQALYAKALSLMSRGLEVSTSYLFAWLRYESRVKLNAVPKTSRFRVPNHFATIFARYLVEQNPALEDFVVMHGSAYDALELPEIDWGF